MALLPITVYGHKILRKKVDPVEEVDLKTIELIKNMYETMRNAYGIGLAANQVGVNKQIFIVDVSPVEGYEDTKPLTAINPEIISRSEDEVVMEEGCLSIPEVRGDVKRPKKATLKYFDTDLKEHTFEADELLARVIQHEYDHLQGILFTDLVSNNIKKKIKKNLIKIKNFKFDFEYPVAKHEDYLVL